MTSRTTDSRLACAALVALAVVLWAPAWTGEHTFFLRDIQLYFYPMKAALARTVRAGEWPWWNPWVRGGLPFFANPQVGLFYPPSALLYLLSLPLGFNWLVIAHYALLSTGAFWWLRREGRSTAAAAFGAIALTWGGVAVSLADYLNNLQALAWTGWIWWAWRVWLEERRTRWLGIVALLFVVQFLGGEPQVTALTGILALLQAWIWPAFPDRGRGRRWWRPPLGLAVVAGASLLAAAVQLVPTIELFLHSGRRQGLSWDEATALSLYPLQSLNLVLPRYFDGPQGLFDFRRVLAPDLPWVYTSYLGVPVAALAAAGVAGRHWRTSLTWGAIAVLGVALALGKHDPLYALVARLPFLSSVRYPEKWLLLTAIAVPVLAARGLDLALVDAGARRRAAFVLGCLAGLVMAGWATFDAGWARDLIARWGEVTLEPDPAGVVEAYHRAFVHVLVAAGATGLLLALHEQLSRRVASFAFIGLAVVDLASVNLAAAPLAPGRLMTERPAILDGLPVDSLRASLRIRTSPIGSSPALLFTFPDLTVGAMHAYSHRIMAPNTSMIYGVLAQDGGEAFRPSRMDMMDEIVSQLTPVEQARWLRMTSAGYVLARNGSELGFEPFPSDSNLGGRLYRVPDPVPRAYLVGRAEVSADSLNVLNRFLADGVDPRRVAFVAAGPSLQGDRRRIDGGVTWLPGSNHAVRLVVRAPEPCLLVLTDAWYPGWRVSVDGRAAPLERVDWSFMGVRLAPGPHRVEFRYRPRGIAWAGLASVLGVAVIGLAIGLDPGRRSRATRTA